jgi:hypothetical protein
MNGLDYRLTARSFPSVQLILFPFQRQTSKRLSLHCYSKLARTAVCLAAPHGKRGLVPSSEAKSFQSWNSVDLNCCFDIVQDRLMTMGIVSQRNMLPGSSQGAGIPRCNDPSSRDDSMIKTPQGMNPMTDSGGSPKEQEPDFSS